MNDMAEYHAHVPWCPWRKMMGQCTCGADRRILKRKEDESALALRRALGSMKL